MGRRAGTIKAENGRYYTPQDMVAAGLSPADPKHTKKLEELQNVPAPRQPTPQPAKKEIMSAEEPRKMSIPKKEIPGNKERYPRITITTFDEKGKHIYTTYIAKPDTLQLNKSETVSFTSTGTPKNHLSIECFFEVVEIE